MGLQLTGKTLEMYDRKRKLGLEPRKLAAYGAMSTFYTHAARPPFLHRLEDNPDSWASKLGAVAGDLEEAVASGSLRGKVRLWSREALVDEEWLGRTRWN